MDLIVLEAPPVFDLKDLLTRLEQPGSYVVE
jgi:hypothetical protein